MMRVAGVVFCAMAVASTASAQRATPVGVVVGAPNDRGPAPSASAGARRSGVLPRDSAWWVPLSSTLLPGLGQIRLGQSRFVVYFAAEAYAVLGWMRAEGEARREGDRYRALAWDVSRAFFEGRGGHGDWTYYEAMMDYVESGVWNRGGGSDFVPESDPNTYNGIIWLKARELSHWPDPDVEPPRNSNEYQDALRYYLGHAVAPSMRWSWRNAQLEWDDYRQSIRRKNEASREAGHFLALVAVNHLLSTVDAFVTLRLRGGLGAPKGGYQLTATVPFP